MRVLAQRLLRLTARDYDQVALLGLMVGVLYALDRAAHLAFSDARLKSCGSDEELAEHRKTLEAIQGCAAAPEPWRAGFYFDSAIMRLAALNERIPKYLGNNQDLAKDVRRVVNKIKHDIDAGIACGWNITFAKVLKSTDELCKLLERALTGTL